LELAKRFKAVGKKSSIPFDKEHHAPLLKWNSISFRYAPAQGIFELLLQLLDYFLQMCSVVDKHKQQLLHLKMFLF